MRQASATPAQDYDTPRHRGTEVCHLTKHVLSFQIGCPEIEQCRALGASVPRCVVIGQGTKFLEHEDASLVAPIHLPFEVRSRPAAFEDEHQAQHVLVEQCDVRRIHVELRREIEQAGGIRMEPRGHVDELRGQVDHVRDSLLHLEHGEVLEHFAADHQVVAVRRLERKVGNLANRDTVPYLRRRQLLAALGEVDAFDVELELPQEVHQRTRTAPEVEHLLRVEHVLDQKRVPRLDGATRLEMIVVALGTPVAGPVFGVVMARAHWLLFDYTLLELGDGHRSFCCWQYSSRRRLDESSTVSRYTTSM